MMKDKQYYIDNLNVLYEDNHLIVIEKPINVLSQKDETNDFDVNEIADEEIVEETVSEDFDEEMTEELVVEEVAEEVTE